MTVLFAAALFAATATAAAGELPEVSPEGLVLQKGKVASVLYVRPGVDFSVYKRFAILDCPVAFRKDWLKDQNRTRTSPSARISQEDMDAIKAGLSAAFLKVFTEELEENGGYPVVKTGGDDVLVLRPAILDLDVTAPDTMSAGRSYTLSDSAGAMTLYLELFDSVTGQILARAVDREASRSGGTIQWRNSVTNSAEANRILRRWASALRARLDEVNAKARP
jgi:Protein of unknown function (DUF3313)